MANHFTHILHTLPQGRQRCTKRGKAAGFTLVELIVVLVILAILAGTLIPALTKYIDKANQKAAVTECRGAVSAAQTLASEVYATKGKDAVGKRAVSSGAGIHLADIEELAEVASGTVTEVTFHKGKVETLTYHSKKGIQVVYSTVAAELYSIQDEDDAET